MKQGTAATGTQKKKISLKQSAAQQFNTPREICALDIFRCICHSLPHLTPQPITSSWRTWCGNEECPSRNFLVWCHPMMYLRSLWSLSLFIQIFRIMTDKSPSYRNIPVHLLKLLSTFTYKTLIISSHWALPSLAFVFNTVENGASLSCLLTGMTEEGCTCQRGEAESPIPEQCTQVLRRGWAGQVPLFGSWHFYHNRQLTTPSTNHFLWFYDYQQFRNITQRPHFQTPLSVFPCESKKFKTGPRCNFP